MIFKYILNKNIFIKKKKNKKKEINKKRIGK